MDNRAYRFSADGSQMEETYDGLPCQRVNNFYADKTNGVYALLNGKLMKRGADRKFNEVMLSQPVNPMAMAKDASGGLWIATWDKGVVHYDAATGKITEQPVTRTTRDKDCCLSMLIDSQMCIRDRYKPLIPYAIPYRPYPTPSSPTTTASCNNPSTTSTNNSSAVLPS